MKIYKIIIGFIGMMFMISCSTSQSGLTRDQRKAAEAYQDSISYLKALQAMEAREFVLEADRIDFRRGNYVYVNAGTNFVSLHGDRATIQLAFSSRYAGPNGIGGITVDGTASNIKMNTDKKGIVTFTMNVQGVGVSATVTLRMSPGDNRCTATVNPNFNSNRIDFTGLLYSEEESNVFKGRSL